MFEHEIDRMIEGAVSMILFERYKEMDYIVVKYY